MIAPGALDERLIWIIGFAQLARVAGTKNLSQSSVLAGNTLPVIVADAPHVAT